MKYACDKCLAVADETTVRDDWMKVTTGAGSTYLLCENCTLGFWQAVSAHEQDQCINAPTTCRHPKTCGSCEYKPETCVHHQKYLKEIAETNLKWATQKLADAEKAHRANKLCYKGGDCEYHTPE